MTTAPAPLHRRPSLGAYALVLPLAAWLLAFVAAPTALMAAYSFCQRDDLGQIVWSFTWDNYARVFAGVAPPLMAKMLAWTAAGALLGLATKLVPALPTLGLRGRVTGGAVAGLALFMHLAVDHLGRHALYLKVLWRSIELAGTTTLVCLVVGYPAAYFIGRRGERWRARLLLLVVIPFWTSFLIRTYAWITILKREGLLNGLLQVARLIPRVVAPTNLLYTPTAVVLGMVYTYLPFMILPIFGSVEQLDASLLEASSDFGARPARAFLHVVLPLTAPGVAAGILLVFVPAIGMFAVSDLLGGAKVPMAGGVIQNQFGQARDMPFGAALGTTLLALFLLVAALLAGPRGARGAGR